LPRKICQTQLILDTSPGRAYTLPCSVDNLPHLLRNRQLEQRRNNWETMSQIIIN
jgi:hypothetical protein